ncbi:MAG: hypothetical protein RIQ72_49 [Candidatus Parcubacteria bacterium]|jgi:hypothetical protein
MKISFPTIPIGINWRDEAAAFTATKSPEMQSLMNEWHPYALILLSLPAEKVTLSHFNGLLHQFLLDLDPDHEYRSRLGENGLERAYNRVWNDEGGLKFISYGDGLVHDGFKLRAYACAHDDNVGGWTGILFANHLCMRSQTYPVLRLAWLFSLWLQHQAIAHTIILSSTTTGQVEVELPTPFDH